MWRDRATGGPAARWKWGLAGVGLLVLWTVVGATWFLRTYLGPVTWDQVLFHLQNGGLDYADPRMLWRGFRCLMAVLVLTGLSLCAVRRCVHLPRVAMWAVWAALSLGAVVSVQATVHDPCEPDPEGADYLATYYVDPAEQHWQPPAQSPDVLVVFVESLDEEYVHPSHPDAPLLPHLTQLRDDLQTLGSLRNLSGASWTMGGIFTALCGLPLQPVGLMSRNTLEYSTRFFPGGRCLTDVMAGLGWDVSFYGGASLKFAGKGQFLKDHSVARRFGREEWRRIAPGVEVEGWGVLDAGLVELAWADMQRPRPRNAPRLSLLLTVDTHGPMGTLDPGCTLRRDDVPPEDVMRSALRCADKAVDSLVRRFVAERNGRPKVVWVMGDHLNPEPLLGDADLAPDFDGRSVFHALARYDANGQPLPMIDQHREFTHVDVLPTLAEAIGLSWQPAAHQLGLGRSLLATPAQPTLAERDGLALMNGRLSCRSPRFQRLWLRGA
jgi:phosphoglycerol transferase